MIRHLVAGALLTLSLAAFPGGEPAVKSQPSAPAKPAAVPAPTPAAAPASLGRPAAGWSATTVEAVSGEAHKAQLAKGAPATLTGEVIDYSCFLQLAKSGEKHRDCGRKCILNGQPAGLLLADGSIVMLVAEEHHPRRDGQVSLKEFLADHVGLPVTATGMATEKGGVKALFVETLAPVAPAAAPAPAPAK